MSTTIPPKSTAVQLGENPSEPYDISFSTAFSPSETVPKKLSICPSAMIMAIPEVKPVITGAGMYDTSLPILNIAAMTSIAPDRKPAMSTPCIPNLTESVSSIADIAPVGPEI